MVPVVHREMVKKIIDGSISKMEIKREEGLPGTGNKTTIV
jgi:hypothetical protein